MVGKVFACQPTFRVHCQRAVRFWLRRESWRCQSFAIPCHTFPDGHSRQVPIVRPRLRRVAQYVTSQLARFWRQTVGSAGLWKIRSAWRTLTFRNTGSWCAAQCQQEVTGESCVSASAGLKTPNQSRALPTADLKTPDQNCSTGSVQPTQVPPEARDDFRTAEGVPARTVRSRLSS